MDTNDDVYILLYKLGLKDAEIQEINKVNVNLAKVLDIDVLQLLKYLEAQGLNIDEIIDVSKRNPWILTESFERLNWLEEHYKSIGIEKEKYKDLIIKYPIALSLNPMNVKLKIQELNEEGFSKEEIQEKFFSSIVYQKHDVWTF